MIGCRFACPRIIAGIERGASGRHSHAERGNERKVKALLRLGVIFSKVAYFRMEATKRQSFRMKNLSLTDANVMCGIKKIRSFQLYCQFGKNELFRRNAKKRTLSQLL